MNKDVLYIDVEDDITTIIGKVKASKEKIIALVPPKRVGVLQSAVNLRLLTRTAEHDGKRIVLITNDHALMGLAASANIPIAKNLQSKPEIAEIPALKIDDDDDIIDGRDLSIGELQKSTRRTDDAGSVAINSVIAENNSKKSTGVNDRKSKSKKSSVPNFNMFRKKFVLIGGSVLLLIGFFVWAIWFAPRATVVITAKTTTVTVDEDISIGTELTTNPSEKTVKAIKQEAKQDISVQFSATGKKKVGDKAIGVVTLSSNDADQLDSGITIAAGTKLTSASGAEYVTDSEVNLSLTHRRDTTDITAADVGTDYNSAKGSVTGAPSSVSASITTTTSGGTSREVTVVSQDDITKATESLDGQKDSTAKDKVEKLFGSSAMIVESSYKEVRSTPSSSVAVDNEASGPVTLKAVVTASMLAIDNSEIENYLKSSVNAELQGKASQKIYKSGANEVKFAQYAELENSGKVRITANATVGPSIDEGKVKEQVKGKNYGDIQSSLESIDGVQDVDTKFWPFWVRIVPNDTDRITIEFKLQDAS